MTIEASSEEIIDIVKKISNETVSIEEFLRAAEIFADMNNENDYSGDAKTSFKSLVKHGIIGNQKGAELTDIDLNKIKWTDFANPDVISPEKALKYTLTQVGGKEVVKPAYFDNRGFIDTVINNVENNVSLFYDRNLETVEKSLKSYDPSIPSLKPYPFNTTAKGQIVHVHRTRVSGEDGMARAHGTAKSGKNPIAYQSRVPNPIEKLPPAPVENVIFRDAIRDIANTPDGIRAKKALILSRTTIMRIGEVADLMIEDINWETGDISAFSRAGKKIRAPQTLSPIALNLLKSVVFNPDGTLADERYDIKNKANHFTLSGKGQGGWTKTGTPIFNINKKKNYTSELTRYQMAPPEKGGGGYGAKMTAAGHDKLMGRSIVGASDNRKITASYAASRYAIGERGEVSVAMGRKPSKVAGGIAAIDDERYIAQVVGQGEDATKRVLLGIQDDLARSFGLTHINQLAYEFQVDIPSMWDSVNNVPVGPELRVSPEGSMNTTNEVRPMTRDEKRLANQRAREETEKSKIREQRARLKALELEEKAIKKEEALGKERARLAKRPFNEKYLEQLNAARYEIEKERKALKDLQVLNALGPNLTEQQKIDKKALEKILKIKTKPTWSWIDPETYVPKTVDENIADLRKIGQSLRDKLNLDGKAIRGIGAGIIGVVPALKGPKAAIDVGTELGIEAFMPSDIGTVLENNPEDIPDEHLLNMLQEGFSTAAGKENTDSMIRREIERRTKESEDVAERYSIAEGSGKRLSEKAVEWKEGFLPKVEQAYLERDLTDVTSIPDEPENLRDAGYTERQLNPDKYKIESLEEEMELEEGDIMRDYEGFLTPEEPDVIEQLQSFRSRRQSFLDQPPQ